MYFWLFIYFLLHPFSRGKTIAQACFVSANWVISKKKSRSSLPRRSGFSFFSSLFNEDQGLWRQICLPNFLQ
jgi:hypothetical protein